MIRGSEPRSLFIQLIQRVPFYQKGKTNIVLNQSSLLDHCIKSQASLVVALLWHSCNAANNEEQRGTSIKGRGNYLCTNFFSCLINVNKICQNFPCIQRHVTAVGSQQNRVFVFMWFKMAMSFAESWKSLTLKLSFMCWGRTDFGITPVEKDSTYI